MGFDPTTQRHASLGGLDVEVGTATFTASQAYVDVPTLFSKVWGGIAWTRSGTSTTGTLTHSQMIVPDNTITSGNVTFWRKDDYIVDAAVIDYILFGW